MRTSRGHRRTRAGRRKFPAMRRRMLKLFRRLPGIAGVGNVVFLEIQPPLLENIMKTSLRCSLAAALAAAAMVTLNAQATPSLGEVDFGQFSPPGKGEEFVEVNLKSNLLGLAAQMVSKAEPDAAKLLHSVESVRVNVVSLTAENREELTQRVQRIRGDLDKLGWERIVKVQGKKGEDVGVFTKTRGGEALAGIVVTVMDSEHVVLVNLVGDIKPDQVASLGESLKIKQLKEAGEAIKK